MQLSYFNNGKRETLFANPEFNGHFDVIVCGLGTAGAIAGIRAAELGLNTLGIEYFNAFCHCLNSTHS